MINNKFILAGPLPYKGEVGGVVILFADIVKVMKTEDHVFDTNGKNYRSNISFVLAFIHRCWFATRNGYEVALHGTANDFVYLGTILLFFNVIFGLQYHTRKFAGNFDLHYENLNPLLKLITRKFLENSNNNFFEAHFLVDYFKHINPHTYWLPNYRKKSSFRSPEVFQGKFIYIGHVSKEKGVDDLLAIAGLLPKSWSIDIYGPIIDNFFKKPLNIENIKFKGIINPDEVQKTLSFYNCLLFPSRRSAEGYPGVIIEAFSVSMPVIACDLRSLREMIMNHSGILTEPENPKAILNAMQLIAADYTHYYAGALVRFSEYEKDRVLEGYFSIINYSCIDNEVSR